MDPITLVARDSLLSQIQVREVLSALDPTLKITTRFIQTVGDRDLSTSLRSLDKTDFFTKDLDRLLLCGEADVAVHSAKDLPDPLPEGIEIIALTRTIDSRDALVLRRSDSIEALKSGAVIATSSERREDAVRALRDDFTFTDLRGAIHTRLLKLITKQVDGVVIAEAALIRLNLTHLNRVYLPGDTAPMQGCLAIISSKGNARAKDFFALYI